MNDVKRLDGPVHRCPPIGSNTMPCCGKTPFEVPPTDRMTVDQAQVTCGQPSGREASP